MSAAVYRGRGQIDVVDIARPEPDTGKALVEIDYCGICGTDLHLVLDGWGSPGSVLGHEWSGRIVDGGDSPLTAGTAVVGLPSIPCGRCGACRAGRTSLCTARPPAGTEPENGAFAEYLAIDPAGLVAVPDGVDQRTAAYTEPLAVALHAVTLAAPEPRSRILVAGGGPIGAAIIAILIARGLDVTAVEPAAARAALAERLGATVRGPDDLEVPPHPGTTVNEPYDIVFETSGVRLAAETGLAQLVGGGLLVLVGTGLDHPRFDTNRIILNEIRITGAFNYDAEGFDAALALIGSGTLPLDDLIEPEPVELGGLLDAMQRLRAGDLPGKVMVRP